MFHCFIPITGCQYNWENCSRSVCWPTRCFMKSSLFIFTSCLPHHCYPIHWDQAKELVRQSLGSRSTQVQELFTLVPHLFGTTCHCLSVQPFQLLPSRSMWRHISLAWPFPLRYQHTQQPIAAMELFHQFSYRTLIRLSRHWAWLHWGYWHYWNLVDW